MAAAHSEEQAQLTEDSEYHYHPREPALAPLAVELHALDELGSAREREAIVMQCESIEKKSFPKLESMSDFMRSEIKGRARTLLVALLPREADSGSTVVAGYLLFERAALVAHILKLCVAEPMRRRGVGRLLMEAAAQRARAPVRGRASAAARPVSAMTLHVDPDRAGAVALYEKMGFREVSRRLDYYCVGRHAACMELDLSPC